MNILNKQTNCYLYPLLKCFFGNHKDNSGSKLKDCFTASLSNRGFHTKNCLGGRVPALVAELFRPWCANQC